MEQLTTGRLFRRFCEAHDRHLHVYFSERNMAASLATYHQNAIGVGTGRGEWGNTPDAMRAIIHRDIDSYTDSIEYNVRERQFLKVSDNTVVCQCLLDLVLQVDTHLMTLRDMRHTVVMAIGLTGEPFIAHIHVSFPTDMHGEEEPYPLKEIEEITAVVDELIDTRTRDLMDAYRKLERMAIHDRLTGLYNRIRLDEKLIGEIKRANRYSTVISVVLIDIDNFKAVNDDHGHLAGDRVLVQLAHQISESLRETDLAGRWGGEEFMIILPETDQNQAYQLSERLRLDFAENAILVDESTGQQLDLTISCGITQHRFGDTMESLFKRADQALFCAKRAGRNQSCLASDDNGCEQN